MMANAQIKTYKADKIIVIGDDLIVDGTVLPIAQKLIFAGMEYNEDLAGIINANVPGFFQQGGSSSVVVKVQVLTYKKNADGTLGDKWNGGRDYVYNMIANNTTWVDSTTGEILGDIGDENIPENFMPATFDGSGNLVQPEGKFYGKEIMLENEFFDQMADLSPVVVRQMIASYINKNKSRVQPKS